MLRATKICSAALINTSVTGRVGLIKLNRPDALNALNSQLVSELANQVEEYDSSTDIGCIVLTGEGKAFAAGADIKEMMQLDFSEVYRTDLFGDMSKVRAAKTPIIAAVNGFALGGGCELAMLCDIIYASDKAKFGQPEIKLGTIPGIGGSQNLTKLIGKSKAMEWVLTGKMYSAEEAEKAGLVAAVFPHDQLLDKAMENAALIASYSRMATEIAKCAVNQSLELGISDGLNMEKRLFQSTFGTKDKMEGMAAFVEKRAPKWSHA
ncbi:putative enoyl-CoA hydratase echA8 [Diplonema papillatum]|nr:putative enoyl-CoA hydratase echA8 [Diplonema papillatum]